MHWKQEVGGTQGRDLVVKVLTFKKKKKRAVSDAERNRFSEKLSKNEC